MIYRRAHPNITDKVARESWTWLPAAQKAPYRLEAGELTLAIAMVVMAHLQKQGET